MIKYELKCAKCETTFDSWFPSSKEYERIKKLKLLCCQNCGSSDVKKSLMAPNLSKNKKNFVNKDNYKFYKIRKKIKNYQKFIKDNFKYVEKNFSHEARSLHYGKEKNIKGIYGKASLNEIKELNEEGINTELVPWINDKEN